MITEIYIVKLLSCRPVLLLQLSTVLKLLLPFCYSLFFLSLSQTQLSLSFYVFYRVFVFFLFLFSSPSLSLETFLPLPCNCGPASVGNLSVTHTYEFWDRASRHPK